MARNREFDEDAVVDKAMESFWTHGYAGTTPAMLVEVTGLGKGSLYNAFHSKRALFERCLDRYHQLTSAMARELLEGPGTARDCVEAGLRAVVDADLAQPQRRGCLIGNSITELAGEDPRLGERLRRMQDETTGWFAERIVRGQAAGDVAPGKDAKALADMLATFLAGLRVMAITHDAPVLYRSIDAVVSLI